jgi:hypothetical protein
LYDQGGPTLGDYNVAPLDPLQQQAMQGITQQATSGQSPSNMTLASYRGLLDPSYLTSNPAFGYLGDIASGAYLDPTKNANFMQSLNRGLDLTAGKLQGQFDLAGRSGSALAADTSTRALGDVATSALANQYNTEAQRQMGAAGLLGQTYAQAQQNQLQGIGMGQAMQNLSYDDLQRLYATGQINQQQAQQIMEAQRLNQNQTAMQPYNNLDWYMRAISGNYGGTQTTVGPQESTNPFLSTLGGAALGASVYSPSKGPWGVIGGAGLGLLGGLI